MIVKHIFIWKSTDNRHSNLITFCEEYQVNVDSTQWKDYVSYKAEMDTLTYMSYCHAFGIPV